MVTLSAPAMGIDGTMYFGYDDKRLHAISTGSSGMSMMQWPKEGQNNFNTWSVLCSYPYLNFPVDSSQNLSTSPTFGWTSVFSASEYQIQLSLSEDFSSVYVTQNISEAQIPIIGIDYGEYFWRVRPILENVHWRLLLVGQTCGADSYHIQISEDEVFTNSVADESGLLVTTFDFPLPDYQKTYYWRVQAVIQPEIAIGQKPGALQP
ncbi:MAG: hypothetical protein IPM81_01810 [Saprospirales bacterium]|nr:hypothetical protein [Saprospirales bacterium]